MDYRAEIDGLRALAVFPIVWFHAQFPFFHGGFLGVDVFFVISGFLITSLIVSDLDQGNFSVANFYERRIRRILPALYAVLLFCLATTAIFMEPDEVKAIGLSALSVNFFHPTSFFGESQDTSVERRRSRPFCTHGASLLKSSSMSCFRSF